MNKRKSEKEWIKIIEEFKSSGLNLTTWCKQNGISKSSIYPYLKKFNSQNKSSEPEWVSIPVTRNVEAAMFSLKVGAVTLDIKNNFDKNALADILSVVIKLC